FQAEDGIRDFHVTGVQTCALPIYHEAKRNGGGGNDEAVGMRAPKDTFDRARRLRREMTLPEILLWRALRRNALCGLRFRKQHPKIGRASCRESVHILVDVVHASET